MDIDTSNIVVERIPVAKDSLKFAGIDTSFNITNIIPTSDAVAQKETSQAEIDKKTDMLKALQIAKKSLSDAISISKDIKSNFKSEDNDAFAPLDDNALKERYALALQIKDILNNAKYNGSDAFSTDYSSEDITLDLSKKDLSVLNIRDEQSIDKFSKNLNELSTQIDEATRKLQEQIDKLQNSRWLSMDKLKTIKLEPKTLGLSNNTLPNLADALALFSSAGNSGATSKREDSTDNAISKDSNATTPTTPSDETSTLESKSADGDNTASVESSDVANGEDSSAKTQESATESSAESKDTNADSQNANATGVSTENKEADSNNATSANDTENTESQTNTQNTNTAQTPSSKATTESNPDNKTENAEATQNPANTESKSEAENAETKQNTESSNVATNANQNTNEKNNADSNTSATNNKAQNAESTQTTSSANNEGPIITPTTPTNLAPDNSPGNNVDVFVS